MGQDWEESRPLQDVEYGPVLFEAEFGAESSFVSYCCWKFVFACLLGTLAYGIGFLGFFYMPIYIYIIRQEYRRRRLYITPEHVCFQTNRPWFCPCCGQSKREKHVLLGLVTDVILEQGCLQEKFGLWAVKLENAGQGNPEKPGCDMNVIGISNALTFKRAVLAAATAKRAGVDITADLIQEALTSENFRAPTSVMGAPIGLMPGAPMRPAAGAVANPETEQALISTLNNLNDGQRQMTNTLKEVAELLVATRAQS
eukprot:NODE_1012_length_1061_cov_81.838330_g968_i0.p1 GENE.NODE_1012_length_1061_cov_81.838330_g968_i0~~NODE_1012_length_1061_cov_81.838330_g968_i0.p1  ORF type:complete len:284 (+),score=68.49 NODE_1012_length_1061_cov_81.838330_g968_i0:86-853(+)